MIIDVPEKLIPIFNSDKRFIVLYGGRDSSKSHTIARLLVLKALSKQCLILCTREIQKSIKTSSYALLVDIINKYNFDKLFEITIDEIRCLKTGSKFIFEGLRSNVANIKSKEGIDYCWVEESNTVSFESWRVLIPTLRKEGSQFFISFNPDSLDDPVYDMFITNSRPDSLVIKINYDDNPFLSDTSKKEIEYMKEHDPDLFDWIYNGNIRHTTESTILTNIIIHNFDIDINRQHLFGEDFGYNDPNAVINCYIYDDELYICREFYKNCLDPEQLKYEMIVIDWLLNQHIVYDSSQPAMGKMLNSTGRFHCSPARKNIGNPVKEGLYKYYMALYLKHFKKIHIHQTNCPNAQREFTKWSWDQDKNEVILDKVRDKDDHTVDATIYALERQATIWYRTFIQKQGK